MKVVYLSVFLVSFLLISDVFADWWGVEPDSVIPSSELFEVDSHDTEEKLEEDYPQYFFSIGEDDEGNIHTEENEVETGEEKPKPDLETVGNENEQPGTGSTENGPLPDIDTSSIDILTEKFDKLLSVFKEQNNKITELEEANKRLILKIDSIEQQIKTNSIILTNVHESPKESSKTTLQKVLHVFNRIMRVRISADDIAVALRAESNSSSKKPIVIRFTNFATKMRVLAASNRLSHTNMTVTSDYSELVAQRRAALLPFLQQARADGHRAFILYDKLVVDGVVHRLEELIAQGEPKQQVEMLSFDPSLK